MVDSTKNPAMEKELREGLCCKKALRRDCQERRGNNAMKKEPIRIFLAEGEELQKHQSKGSGEGEAPLGKGFDG